MLKTLPSDFNEFNESGSTNPVKKIPAKYFPAFNFPKSTIRANSYPAKKFPAIYDVVRGYTQ